MVAPQQKPFSVTFHPCRVPVIHTADGRRLFCDPLEAACVTVRAPLCVLGRKVVESSDRFCEFEESDSWAFAAGMARVRLVPFVGGEHANLGDFVDPPCNLKMRCVVGQSVDPSDDELLMSSVEFALLESAEAITTFFEAEKTRLARVIYGDRYHPLADTLLTLRSLE